METKSFFNITNGVVTWAAIICSTAANSILIFTATINEAKIEQLIKAATCFICSTI